MVNIARSRQNSLGGSPKAAEVGEIDTKAPFQSVKAAVSLFGEPSSTSPKAKPLFSKKPKPQTQGVLDKEAQFHLALNELNKLKEQLRGAESKKNKTLSELDKASRTLDELKQRLKNVNESKQSILEQSEALKDRARKLEEAILNSNVTLTPQDVVDSVKQDANSTREEYKAAILELDTLKQQLSSLRREYDATLEAKASAIRISQKADAAAEAHQHRVTDLTKQIGSMQEALTNIKSSSKNAEVEHQKLLKNKDEELCSRRLSKNELKHKVLALKTEHQSLLAAAADDNDLRAKLNEINAEILSLQEKISKARAAYSEYHKATTSDIEVAKKSLEQVAEEKISLENSVEFVKLELQHVGKELFEHKYKQEEADALVSKLQAELDDKKNVLEARLVNKTSAADASDDMVVSIEQLTLETERTNKNSQELKMEIEQQQQQVKTTRAIVAEMQNKLKSLHNQVEEAKAAEKAAQDEIRALSERAQAAQDQSTSESNGKIKLSNEEYNSLMEKIDESEKLADIKVTANLAQVEALVASQKEAARKYEAVWKEIEELKKKEEEALKTAELAEAAKGIIEAELHRWHQQEQHINQPTPLAPSDQSNA